MASRKLATPRQGFIILDAYSHRYVEVFSRMSVGLSNGQFKFKVVVVNGLENTPQALIGLHESKSFGKLIVQVAKD